jgi:hypothetical protein
VDLSRDSPPQDHDSGFTTSVPSRRIGQLCLFWLCAIRSRQKPRLLFHTYVVSWTPWGSDNGPSHGEVIVYQGRTVFGQMNAVPTEAAKATLCRALTGGYSQVEAAADAFGRGGVCKLPDKPVSPFDFGSRSHYGFHVIRNRQVHPWLRCYQESPVLPVP